MTNFNELCEKETEVFISNTLKGLKSIRREASEAIKKLRELESYKEVESDE